MRFVKIQSLLQEATKTSRPWAVGPSKCPGGRLDFCRGGGHLLVGKMMVKFETGDP